MAANGAARFVVVVMLVGVGACRPIGNAPLPDPAGVGTDCQALAPTPRRIWRLSIPQYSNSIRDLLGLAAGPTVDAGPADAPEPFLVDDSLSVDPRLALALETAAHDLLADSAALIPSLAACRDGEAEDACATRFAASFGRRAFRRPLGDDEVTDLLAVYAEGRKQDFASGIRLMIEGLLISPSFLFRLELGSAASGATTLTPYELASQLSYTLLDSTPDASLLAAAEDGRLASDDGIAAEVDRLLAGEAARQGIDRVVVGWLHGRDVAFQRKDPALLAALAGAGGDADQALIAGDLYQSFAAFVDDRLWRRGGRQVTDLLGSSEIFVNQRLATLFGVPFTGADPASFALADATDRPAAGILAQPAFLWAATVAGASPIVSRALTVGEAIVCAPVPQPPGTIHADPAVVAQLASLTREIDRSDYALSTLPCRTCHPLIDPYGRVLEDFDAVGRLRATVDGAPVDASADFSSTPPLQGRIAGAVAFAQAITAGPSTLAGQRFAGCAVQKLASHAVGRALVGDVSCDLRRLTRSFTATDGTMGALVREVALASFVRTRGGTAP